MKEKWLEDIQEKMNNFELNEPHGLWDQIQQRRESQIPKRKQLWIMPVVRAAAACAIVIILSLAYIYMAPELNRADHPVFTAQEDSLNNDAFSLSLAENNAEISRRPYLSERHSSSSDLIASNQPDPQYTPETVKTAETVNIISTPDSIPADNLQSESEQNIVADRNTIVTANKNISQTDDRLCQTSASDIKKRDNNRFSIGVFSSGIIGNSNSQRPLINPSALSYKWLDSDNYNDDITTLVRSRATADNDVSGIEMQHHIPMRFGLTAQYDITPRFGVESGITYSRLSSDLNTENSRPIKGEQVLHYIGMPVNLKYRLASWKVLSIYASAGAMLEKCVDGTLTKHTTLPNGATEKKSLKLKENALQWSSNIAIDLQLNLTRHIGLYVQPGVAYYFNNGSEIRSIYKDRQFNFNINLGLRYSFGKNQR